MGNSKAGKHDTVLEATTLLVSQNSYNSILMIRIAWVHSHSSSCTGWNQKFETRTKREVSFRSKMGTQVTFRTLYGYSSTGAVCSLLQINSFNLLLDCGWDHQYDPTLLKPVVEVYPCRTTFPTSSWSTAVVELRPVHSSCQQSLSEI